MHVCRLHATRWESGLPECLPKTKGTTQNGETRKANVGTPGQVNPDLAGRSNTGGSQDLFPPGQTTLKQRGGFARARPAEPGARGRHGRILLISAGAATVPNKERALLACHQRPQCPIKTCSIIPPFSLRPCNTFSIGESSHDLVFTCAR